MAKIDLNDQEIRALAMILTFAKQEADRMGLRQKNSDASWVFMKGGNILAKLDYKGLLEKLSPHEKQTVFDAWNLSEWIMTE